MFPVIYRTKNYLQRALVMQFYFGLIYPNLNILYHCPGRLKKLLPAHYKSCIESYLKQFVVLLEKLALDHFLVQSNCFMLKMCIDVWFVTLFINLFQRAGVILYAMKVDT